jgi:hypothetical protein
MDQAVVLAVGASVGLGGPLEREGVGGQGGKGQLAAEPPGQLGPAAAVPAGREGGREGGDLGAAQGQPAAVEGGPQGQGDRPGAIPGADQGRALVGQQPQGGGQCLGVAAGLDDQVGAPAAGVGGHRLGRGGGVDGPDPEGRGGGPPGRLRLRSQHHRPGPAQQRRHQDADRAQARDHDRLPQPGRGVQGHLEGGLDHRVQGGGPRVQVVDRNGVGGAGHEPVLVGMEGEHPLALPERPGWADDPTDGAVAVAEGVGEGAGQGAQGLVQGQVRVDLAPVGEQLGAAGDPGPLGGHQDAALGRVGKLDLPQLDPSRSHEVDRAGPHGQPGTPRPLRQTCLDFMSGMCVIRRG